jgi:hypothetical protein
LLGAASQAVEFHDAYTQVREMHVDQVTGPSPEMVAFRTRLIALLNARCGRGREDSIWWPKWYQCEGQYSRWDDPAVLLELAKKDRAMEYYASTLVIMVHAVEEVRERAWRRI